MNYHSIDHLKLAAKAFDNMKKLRFLKIYTPSVFEKYTGKFSVPTTGLESISSKITYFHWEGYPGKSLPSNFCVELLLELNLAFSQQVEMLWEGVQVLFINFNFITPSTPKYKITFMFQVVPKCKIIFYILLIFSQISHNNAYLK